MNGRIEKSLHGRLLIALSFIFFLIFLVVVRCAWLQIKEGGAMADYVREQVGGSKLLHEPRGPIVDRNGAELAVSVMTKSLYVDPSHVDNSTELAAELAPLISISEEEIKDDISHGGGFVWVKRRLEPEEVDSVRCLIQDKGYIDRLGFRDEPKRYFPNDSLAANVIGFVGMDDKGLDGIEHSCDKLIRGEQKKTFELTDTHERPILDSLFNKGYNGDACKTIELTLDVNLQFIVEQELDRAVAVNAPKAITAIVMDPKTGDILAMASRPSFNPNHFGDYAPENWKNRAVSFIYEPGSTFKAVVAAAALQEKKVTPNQVFVDPGHVTVSGRRIQNWNGESFGTVTFTDVVKNSLNTGFAMVGLDLGADRLTKYAKLFGFGQSTGIRLPGEEAGLLFDPEDMRASDIATMSIGQSIAVTPLQLVTAMGAIANDGVLLKPHIVKSIKNADGSLYKEIQKEEVRRTIDSATDKTLIGLLEQVVASGGGKKAAVKGYRIAGKTGTAQKIRSDGAGYMEGHYIASFCGFAPVEDPQLVVLVMIDDPSAGSFYGGQIAAPVAGAIFSQALRYYHTEPSSNPFAGMERTSPKQEADRVPKQPEPKAPEGKVVVPDVRGRSIREAAEELSKRGLVMHSEGSGIAIMQSISGRTIVDEGTEIDVTFSE